MAARSKAWVCGHSLAGIAGSNPPGAWMCVSCECCVLSGRGLCIGLITRPEESYPVLCVSECDFETLIRKRPRPTRVVEPWKKILILFGLWNCVLITMHGLSNIKCINSFLFLVLHSSTYLFTAGVEVVYFHLITLRHTPQSEGHLWKTDRPVAETSTWQHKHCTREKHPCPLWDSNPRSQQALGRRPTP
jgi:hypothetical protein